MMPLRYAEVREDRGCPKFVTNLLKNLLDGRKEPALRRRLQSKIIPTGIDMLSTGLI